MVSGFWVERTMLEANGFMLELGLGREAELQSNQLKFWNDHSAFDFWSQVSLRECVSLFFGWMIIIPYVLLVSNTCTHTHTLLRQSVTNVTERITKMTRWSASQLVFFNEKSLKFWNDQARKRNAELRNDTQRRFWTRAPSHKLQESDDAVYRYQSI